MSELKSVQLRQQRMEVVKQSQAFLDKVEGENRDLNAEEQEQYDKMQRDIDSYGLRIERHEKAEALVREAHQSIRSEPGNHANGKEITKDDDKRAAETFTRYLRGGMKALSGEELRALNSTVDTEGGFLVAPIKWVNELITKASALGPIRSISRVFQLTDAASLGAVSLDEDPSDADWTPEVGEPTIDTSMKFGKRHLVPTQLSKEIKVSERLLRLATQDVDSIIRDALARIFSKAEENAFCNGDGSSKPLGVFVASDVGIPTSRDMATDNTGTAITFDGLINALTHLEEEHAQNATWVFHRLVVRQIRKLKDLEGRYVWEPSVRVGEPDAILGRAVRYSPYAPSTMTTGLYVGIVGDFQKYWIAEAVNMRIQVLNELYARTNQIGYIARKELDAMPVLGEAFCRVKLG